jgi:hypothetical protein
MMSRDCDSLRNSNNPALEGLQALQNVRAFFTPFAVNSESGKNFQL